MWYNVLVRREVQNFGRTGGNACVALAPLSHSAFGLVGIDRRLVSERPLLDSAGLFGPQGTYASEEGIHRVETRSPHDGGRRRGPRGVLSLLPRPGGGARRRPRRPRKKTVHTVIHDREPDWDISTEKPGYRIEADAAYADVRPEEFDALILSGGRAPEYARLDEHAPRIVRAFWESGKPVGAICHGGLFFVAAGIDLTGRTLTATRGIRPELERLGARYLSERVVVDRNLVTAQSWRDLPGFMREFMRVL